MMEILGWHRIDENLWTNEAFHDDWKAQIERIGDIFSADIWTNENPGEEERVRWKDLHSLDEAKKWAEAMMIWLGKEDISMEIFLVSSDDNWRSSLEDFSKKHHFGR